MKRLLIGIAAGALLAAGPAEAQMTIIQTSDGTSATVLDLGGMRTYSDSHGNTGTIIDLGGGFQSFYFNSPGGRAQSGTALTFEAPRPSEAVQPMFVLPIRPTEPIGRSGAVVPVVPLTPGFGAAGAVTPGVGVFGSGRGR